MNQKRFMSALRLHKKIALKVLTILHLILFAIRWLFSLFLRAADIKIANIWYRNRNTLIHSQVIVVRPIH